MIYRLVNFYFTIFSPKRFSVIVNPDCYSYSNYKNLLTDHFQKVLF